jgi:hypothetical protein
LFYSALNHALIYPNGIVYRSRTLFALGKLRRWRKNDQHTPSTVGNFLPAVASMAKLQKWPGSEDSGQE